MRAFRSLNPDGDEPERVQGSASANIGVMSATMTMIPIMLVGRYVVIRIRIFFKLSSSNPDDVDVEHVDAVCIRYYASCPY